MRVPTHPPARPAASSARAHPTDAPVTELDVRDDLRNRREPFSRIMAAVETVPQDGVLHLRATFEPVPLLTLLGKRGYLYESVQHGPDDWSAWFWRSTGANDAAERTSVRAPVAAGSATTDDESDDVHLDVRGLEPPEPMVRTLAALEALEPGRTLVQVNVRVPQFLLPILAERGFVWEVDEGPADRVLVRIRRRG